MFAAVRRPRFGLADIFSQLVDSHPAALLGRMEERRALREAQDRLAGMPAHLRDDLGLSPLPPAEPEHPAIARLRTVGRH